MNENEIQNVLQVFLSSLRDPSVVVVYKKRTSFTTIGHGVWPSLRNFNSILFLRRRPPTIRPTLRNGGKIKKLTHTLSLLWILFQMSWQLVKACCRKRQTHRPIIERSSQNKVKLYLIKNYLMCLHPLMWYHQFQIKFTTTCQLWRWIHYLCFKFGKSIHRKISKQIRRTKPFHALSEHISCLVTSVLLSTVSSDPFWY